MDATELMLKNNSQFRRYMFAINSRNLSATHIQKQTTSCRKLIEQQGRSSVDVAT